MMQNLFLSFTLPSGEHKKIELKPDPSESVLIGRNRASHIKLNLPSVSRQHAKIFFESGNYWIEDLGSSNGTFVNREQVHHVRISPGDLLQCGEFEIEVLSHAETSIYGAETPSLEEVEVISDDSLPASVTPALEPRPRPQASKLSVPPPRASGFMGGVSALNSRPAVHSKAPTNQPQDRANMSISSRSTVNNSQSPQSVRIQELGDELAAIQSQKTQLESEFNKQQEELSNVQAQAEAQRALADKFKAEAHALSEQNEQSLEAYKELETKNQSLEEELQRLRSAGSSSSSELQQAYDDLSRAEEARDQGAKQLQRANNQLRQMQEELSLVKESAPQQSELDELRSENDQLRDDLRAAQRKQRSLEKKVSSIQSEQSNVQQIQDQLDELNAEQSMWGEERASLNQELKDLRSQLDQQHSSDVGRSASSVTPADWAAHNARFEQLTHELRTLRRAVQGQAVGEVKPNTHSPQPTSEGGVAVQRPSIPPREQPREWRGLV